MFDIWHIKVAQSTPIARASFETFNYAFVGLKLSRMPNVLDEYTLDRFEGKLSGIGDRKRQVRF